MSRESIEGWQPAALGDVFDVNWGDTSITKSSYSDSGYTAYSASGPDGFMPSFQHDADGVVVSAIGAGSGRCFLAKGKWTAIKNTLTVLKKPAIDYSIKFAFQLLNDPKRWPIEGGAQPFIGLKKARAATFQWPPPAEQRRIAEILSSVDEAIQATQAVIEQTRKVKEGVLERLLTKGIGHTRFKQTEIGEIPEGWQAKALGEVCALSGGAGFPIKYQGRNDLPYPFIKVSDMNLSGNEKFIIEYNNTIDEDIAKALRARPFPKGATIFPKVGAALLTNKRRILIRPTFVDNNIMVANPSSELDSEYLYHCFCRLDFSEYVQSGAVPSINQGTVGAIPIPVPPLSEQKSIADILSALDETEERLATEMAQRHQLKASLSSDLLTGRRRVSPDLPLAAE